MVLDTNLITVVSLFWNTIMAAEMPRKNALYWVLLYNLALKR